MALVPMIVVQSRYYDGQYRVPGERIEVEEEFAAILERAGFVVPSADVPVPQSVKGPNGRRVR